MLRMIIADDEYIVRDGLMNIISWDAFGIEIIGEASNGQQAYELCQQLQPDILFTDIRMPKMDGFEVAMKLKDQGLPIKIIIISGIQDFNYAKTALNIDAEGYILKPVDIDELLSVIKKVVNNISLEKNLELKLQHLMQQLHENISIAREKFLRNLLHGVRFTEQDLLRKLEYFEIPFEITDSCLTALVQVDDFEQRVEDMAEVDKQLLSFSVHNIIEEIISNNCAGTSLCINENELVIIFNNTFTYNEKYISVCDEITSCVNKFLKLSLSIGIGRIVGSIMNIRTSYTDAVAAIQHRFYTGKSSIINISDIAALATGNDDNVPFVRSEIYEFETRMISFIKLGDHQGLLATLNDIFQHLCKDSKVSVSYIQTLCVEMVFAISMALYEAKENLDEMVHLSSFSVDTIYKKKDIFDLKDYMISIFQDACSYFSKKHLQKNSKLVYSIKELIDTRYAEDISVSTISKEVFLTPNYISLIFKQVTGETIIEYLTQTRMEKAKKLLKSTDLKVLDIAEMVGYENTNYFSAVFNKYTGMYPQKFRTEI